MAYVKPVRTEEEYEAALARIDALMEAEPDSVKGEELDVLADLVELYESKHVQMGFPDPVAAIEFRMDQAGLSPRDLVPFIGSRARVSELLSGKRPLTMAMARALHEHLGIPADVLLREPGATLDKPRSELEWSRFPLTEMAKRGWIRNVPNLKHEAESLIRELIERAGGQDFAGYVLCRKNDYRRTNAKMDPYALQAWCWQVLATANEKLPDQEYQPHTVTVDFLKQVAKLSWF
jgi:HTH-type transcriptional regulator/antitoxin HigA